MRIVEVVEAPSKTAVFAFGRMNPPTAGHKKLVNTIMKQTGDHYLFLGPSKSASPATDPLTHEQKVKYATAMFPGIQLGDSSVRTWVQAMQYLQKRGYTDIIYVAGSDRANTFNTLLNRYNGKDYNFNSIKTVDAGTRDPDSPGIEGISASKMRELAMRGDEKNFIRMTPLPTKLAKTMYDEVRKGMGVQKEPA